MHIKLQDKHRQAQDRKKDKLMQVGHAGRFPGRITCEE